MSENHEYPSLPEMGSNLAKFAFDLIKKSMKGDALRVSEEVAMERLEICKSCEYYDPEQLRCKHCGCYLEHKVRWALDSCPIEKWGQSDKDWVEGGKFEELYNHVKLGTEPTSPWQLEEGEIPDFPPAETTPIGFIYIYKNTQWQFTGESWVPYVEESEFEKELREVRQNRPEDSECDGNHQDAE